MKNAAEILLPGSLLVLADQTLKHWSNQNLGILNRRPFLGQEFLVLSRVLNRGIGGDEFSWIPTGRIELYTRYLPTAIWIAILAFAAARRPNRWERLGLTLLLAGGASNLFNHWTSEFVTDPLQIYWGRGEYLPFNLADVGILAGAILAFASSSIRSTRL